MQSVMREKVVGSGRYSVGFIVMTMARGAHVLVILRMWNKKYVCHSIAATRSLDRILRCASRGAQLKQLHGSAPISSLEPEQISPSLAGFGEGESVAWHPAGYTILAGAQAQDEELRFWSGSQAWPGPYLDEFDGASQAADVVVDRHGYVLVLGTSKPLGWSRIILARLAP